MAQLNMIVTGTGRCGTVYMAKLLTSLGLPCGHESLFGLGGERAAIEMLAGKKPIKLSEVSSKNWITQEEYGKWVNPKALKADSSYLAAPFLKRPLLSGVPMLHVVRHPLKVVSSFVKNGEYFFGQDMSLRFYEKFIYHHQPQLLKLKPGLERACGFWVGWNQMIEDAYADREFLFHRIEDGLSESLMSFLGCKLSDGVFDDTKANSWDKERRVDFKIAEIPAGTTKKNFINMMIRYRYED